MHIVSGKPLFLTRAQIPGILLEKEGHIAREKALESGTPEAHLEKSVEKALNQFYIENVLDEQKFVFDGKKTIATFLKEQSEALGHPIKLGEFVRFELGEQDHH
jgi:elongation factor Ts